MPNRMRKRSRKNDQFAAMTCICRLIRACPIVKARARAKAKAKPVQRP